MRSYEVCEDVVRQIPNWPSLSALAAVSAGLGMPMSALMMEVEERLMPDRQHGGQGAGRVNSEQ